MHVLWVKSWLGKRNYGHVRTTDAGVCARVRGHQPISTIDVQYLLPSISDHSMAPVESPWFQRQVTKRWA